MRAPFAPPRLSEPRKLEALAQAVATSSLMDSPLANTCDVVLPMGAGPEVSVAATKTFIASVAALARFVARGDVIE